jgi:hypothetical protein
MTIRDQEDFYLLGYNALKINLLLEEHVASIFRVEKEAKPETIIKKISYTFFRNVS